jgi:hypothetical protein
MKKKVGPFAAILLLMIFGLSGCTENLLGPTSKFIGTWRVMGDSDENETWIFYSNGTVKNLQTQEMDGDTFTSISWYIYEIQDKNLCFSSNDVLPGSPSYYFECFEYEFSDDSDILALIFDGITIMRLEKI